MIYSGYIELKLTLIYISACYKEILDMHIIVMLHLLSETRHMLVKLKKDKGRLISHESHNVTMLVQ